MPYKDIERRAECKRRWYLQNKELTIARSRQWAEANSERRKEIAKEWYERNREALKAQRDSLSDRYVRALIYDEIDVRPEQVPQQLVELHREYLRLVRELREIADENCA